jgi:F420-dependent hydroxymycolic acid dehydrogenase
MERRAFLKAAAGSSLIPAMMALTASESAEVQNPAAPQPRRLTSGARSAGTRSIVKPMVGFMLAHEQFPVPELVGLGVAAEDAGFDLLATSDHLQPWQSNEGHAGQAWITISALGERTKKVWIGPTVTCPTFRYNPAVVAEAFTSLGLLYPGRIFLGIGSGEALNEEPRQVYGRNGPSVRLVWSKLRKLFGSSGPARR